MIAVLISLALLIGLRQLLFQFGLEGPASQDGGGWLGRSRSQPWKPIMHEVISAIRGVQVAALASLDLRKVWLLTFFNFLHQKH